MQTYHAGEIIRHVRNKKGITQERLCDGGFISTVNLSRIENGIQNISMTNFKMLMERLGENEENYLHFFMGSEEYKIFNLRNSITDSIYLNDYAQAEKLVTELENSGHCKEGLNRQFLLAVKADVADNKLYGDVEPTEYDPIMHMLEEAIRITLTAFDEAKLDRYLLTDLDSRIINQIALVHICKGEMERGVNLLYALKNRIENNYADDTAKARYYTMVLYNLSKHVGLLTRYKEEVELCNLGIRSCINSGRNRLLPSFIFNKAYALNELGDTESCKRLLPQAYYGFYMMERFKQANTVKEYAKSNFDIDF